MNSNDLKKEIIHAGRRAVEQLIKVAKEDIGKVIGRQGRTADAIRTILNCPAAKINKRYILQIIDE